MPGPVVCPQFLLADPLRGTLEGDAASADLVWLRGSGGQHLVVVWPAGFTARFAPTLQLVNEKGMVVARAGQTVTLGQVAPGSHAGTEADPYLAQGLLFGSCYQPAH